MYKLKLGTFLKQHAPAMEEKASGKKGVDNGKISKIELDIDEIKKQLKAIAGQKRKHEEIDGDIKTPPTVASN